MDLTGQLLIAMPGMGDPRFARAVVFICAHSDDGAMGLIVNKPVSDMQLSEVFSRMDMPTAADAATGAVYYGGPVETERGFVLHRDTGAAGTDPLLSGSGYAVTATQDILVALSEGRGPRHSCLRWAMRAGPQVSSSRRSRTTAGSRRLRRLM